MVMEITIMNTTISRRPNLFQMARMLFDGFFLRCPRCHKGHMFKGFTMHQTCPRCDLQFEAASGEITGGMGINIVATLFLVIIAAGVFGPMTWLPVLPLLGGLGLLVILFPILFYRSSRGMWAGILYLTGDNQEAD
jgi:uncharacterized protein (DUF983 family)